MSAGDRGQDQEVERQAILNGFGFVPRASLPGLDRITRVARAMFEVPIALVTIPLEDRMAAVSDAGAEGLFDDVPLDQTFCQHTLAHDSVFVVPDALADRRFARNRFVTGEPFIRFYAGAPLFLDKTLRLAVLCLIDRRPRDLRRDDMMRLIALAQLSVGEGWLQSLDHGEAQALGVTSPPPAPQLARLTEPTLTGAHVRAARGLLDWSIADLAAAAGVSPTTIKRIEASDSPLATRESVSSAVRRALDDQGVQTTALGPSLAGVQLVRSVPRRIG